MPVITDIADAVVVTLNEANFGQPLEANDHQCPKCKRKYSDERTVAAYRCKMHHDLEHASVALGWAYAWSKDERYAKAVRCSDRSLSLT